MPWSCSKRNPLRPLIKANGLRLGRLLALAAWPLVSSGSAAPAALWVGADLFTNGPPIQLQIQIASQDLNKLRQDPRAFVPATVGEAGTQYLRVAVHLKGSVGSFRPLDDKPAFTLDFAQYRADERFHGLRRIHLNNSVEDPSYCCEQLGSELFRAAGIPAPRVGRAVVFLNDRRLGIYVLKEGFTEDFLGCYFKQVGANLYEPGEGHDVNQHLKRTSIRAAAMKRSGLKSLAQAAFEPDLQRRWKRLDQALDLDSFVRFMALEVLIGHRDGYCLARNNFRIYQNLDTGKLVFFPHGMDQLFGSADLPWRPHMAGLVARAVLETPQGQQRYSEQFRSLFQALCQPEKLTNRVDEVLRSLIPVSEPSEISALELAAASLDRRISERFLDLQGQLAAAQASPLGFVNDAALLTDWVAIDSPASGRMDRVSGPGGSACLHILASSESSGSWRTKARLTSGRYRFEGKVCVAGFKPLSFGIHQGAALRILGQPRESQNVPRDEVWHLASQRFEVNSSETEIAFICEFRAAAGEAWFDCGSLRVIRER